MGLRLTLLARLGIVLLCIGFLTANSSFVFASPNYGGHLIVAVPTDPDTFDAHKAVAAATKEIDFNIYEGLVSYNSKGEIIPALAVDWDISADGTEYIFTLREDVFFHNNRLMTAEDVVYSLNRIRDDSTGYPLTWHKNIEHLEILDTQQIRLVLAEPYAPFLSELADAAIIPSEAVETLGVKPIGTGPFKFVEWAIGQHIKLTKFEKYWKAELPYLDGVTFKIVPNPATAILNLKAGAVHVIPRLSADVAWQVEEDPEFRLLSAPMNTPQLMAYNLMREPFDDIRVRQAINYGIDKDLLIEGAAWGYGSKIGSNMSPSMEAFYVDYADYYPYDPDKARQLLKNAGYPHGFQSTLSLPVDYDLHVKAGEMAAAMLAEIGIELELELVEWGTWLERIYTKRDYDLTIVGLGGKLDPHTILNRYTSDYSRNFFNFAHEEYDALIEEGFLETNPSKRGTIYARCQEILAEEAAALFIMDPNDLVAMAKEVNGWQHYPKYVDDLAHVYFGK